MHILVGEKRPYCGRQLISLDQVPPLEDVLKTIDGPSLSLEDVPIWFVTEPAITDHLFRTPSRREVEKLLLQKRYSLKKERGHGSHRFWVGTDGRGFPVPKCRQLWPGFNHRRRGEISLFVACARWFIGEMELIKCVHRIIVGRDAVDEFVPLIGFFRRKSRIPEATLSQFRSRKHNSPNIDHEQLTYPCADQK